MKFASLGSGSSGNATLIRDRETLLMIDCGFGIRETTKRMARLGLSPDQIDALLVTHEHSDHIKGVAPLARRFNIPVYMTQGTWLARDYGQIPDLRIIENYSPFQVGRFDITPVPVPHDAREPAQFILDWQKLKLGILTDLGKITPHILLAYRNCHGLLVEANHDLDMLHAGPYPPSLKFRVAGDWGHLNNGQTVEFLESVGLDSVQRLVVGHISRQNNSLERARAAMERIAVGLQGRNIEYACQDEGFDWLELT